MRGRNGPGVREPGSRGGRKRMGACAVALANLELFETEKTLERLQPKIHTLADGLKPIAALPHVAAVRQRGFMVGVELMRDVKARVPYAFEERLGFRVCQAARAHGVILRPLGNTIVLMPPLSLKDDELQLLLRALHAAIVEITGA